MPSPKRKLRNRGAVYTAGEHGANRVWLTRRGHSGLLYLGWYEELPTGERVRRTKSLGRLTLSDAKLQADRLAATLRKDGRQADEHDMPLSDLFALYQHEVTPYKGVSARDHDKRAMPLFLRCWGAKRLVSSLKPLDWERYCRDRRSGALAPPNARGGPVRDRTLEQDLRLLRAILNWALGNELIDRMPMAKCTVPKELNVRRPLLYEEDYAAMLQVAHRVHPRCRLALLLAHETGRRAESIRGLRWSDIDVHAGIIRWRAETDKEGRSHESPAVGELLAELRAQHEPGDAWVFQSGRVTDQPVNRKTFQDWWHEMEELAGVPHQAGRAWHSSRRKWATERKGLPLSDVAAAGGWNGTQTLTTVYIQPDPQTMRHVVANRTPLHKPTRAEDAS